MTKIHFYPKTDEYHRIIENCKIKDNCTIFQFVNLYNSKIGFNVSIGPFTEIGGAKIGDNTRIGTGCFIPKGITIGNNCFISPKVCMINDKIPTKYINGKNKMKKTVIKDNVVLGANATILCGITIGDNSIIGAGSVVTKNIPANEIWSGNPAKFMRKNK